MLQKIDFENTKPDFSSDSHKWYLDKNLNAYISYHQDSNLPALLNIACFVVKNIKTGEENYVLINEKQQVIKDYKYSYEGYEQMKCFINILKINKNYGDHENI